MNEKSLALMAWRNIWRHRRRTLITLFSIAFGMLLAILFTGIGDATYSEMIDLAAKMGSGHVTIQHSAYLETPSFKHSLEGAKRLRDMAARDKDVKKATLRISGQAMFSTASNSAAAGFVAVDPTIENASTISYLEAIKVGEMFKSSRDNKIVLGSELASNLDLTIGKKVVYTLTDKQGEIVSGLARVSGIVKTGAPSIDGAIALLPLDTLRETLGYGEDEGVEIAVFLGDQRKSETVAKRLNANLTGNAVARTWSETQPDLADFITMKVSGALFFEMLIMILVAAGIFNTLFVSVMERIREFGIMLAIGFSPPKLFRLVVWESFWLGIVGLIGAALLTSWPYYYLSTKGIDFSAMYKDSTEVAGVVMDSVLFVRIFPENAALIAGVVLVATIVAGLYPAWRAGRVVPVEAIKLV